METTQEKFDAMTDPSRPVIGETVRMGMFLGPECTVMKVQAIELVGDKEMMRPQDIEFVRGTHDQKEGYDEMMVNHHPTRPNIVWLLWVNRKETINVDIVLQQIYDQMEAGKKMEACKIVYEELNKIGSDNTLWKEFFDKADTDKMGVGTAISVFVTAKPYRKKLSGYNEFFDKVFATLLKDPNYDKEKATKLIGGWRVVDNKPDKNDTIV